MCNNCFRKRRKFRNSGWMIGGSHLFQSQESTYGNPVCKAHKEFKSGFLRIGQTWIWVVLSVIYSFVRCVVYEAAISQLWTLPSEFCLLMLELGLWKSYLSFVDDCQKVAQRGTGRLEKEEGAPFFQIAHCAATITLAVVLYPRSTVGSFLDFSPHCQN